MRRARPFALLIVALTLLATPVAAKEEGVRARLDAPVRLDSAPGKTIRVSWRLVDAQGGRFGAGGIYLRVSRCGRRPVNIPATVRPGHGYSARVKVPQDGIRKLVVGLKGWRIIGDRKERADVYFQFDPPLSRKC